MACGGWPIFADVDKIYFLISQLCHVAAHDWSPWFGTDQHLLFILFFLILSNLPRGTPDWPPRDATDND